MAEWIKCSEQMPEPAASVLLAIPTWRDIPWKQFAWQYEVGWLDPASSEDSDMDAMFCTEADDYDVENVEFWQPITAPQEPPHAD